MANDIFNVSSPLQHVVPVPRKTLTLFTTISTHLWHEILPDLFRRTVRLMDGPVRLIDKVLQFQFRPFQNGP